LERQSPRCIPPKAAAVTVFEVKVFRPWDQSSPSRISRQPLLTKLANQHGFNQADYLLRVNLTCL